MANEEHLAKLREGVEAWNQWREKNRDLQPDLQGAYLGEAQLQVAKLGDAQMQGANLSQAQLQGANLSGVFFDNATSLREAILGDEKYGVALLADVSWGGVNNESYFLLKNERTMSPQRPPNTMIHKPRYHRHSPIHLGGDCHADL